MLSMLTGGVFRLVVLGLVVLQLGVLLVLGRSAFRLVVLELVALQLGVLLVLGRRRRSRDRGCI
jgi:hypothetical protein